MIVENLDSFEKFGIYKITNLKNNKIYIGSTGRSFSERFTEHSRDLKNNKHKNYYLQSSYNKWGESIFKFEILEIVDDVSTLHKVEQKYLDLLCTSKKVSYNINIKATGGYQFSEETYKKRGRSFSITLNKSIEYSKQIKACEITIDDVPEKYKKLTTWYISPRDSSKNRTKENGYNFDHLKVSKTMSEEFKRARKISALKNRENRSPYIEIYDTFGNYINTFRSATDIEEYSIKHPEYFPILDRNIKSRTGNINYLKKQNINNCCKNITKHYKGLQFKYITSNKEIFFLTITDINPMIKLNTKQRKQNNMYDKYSRLLEQSNMKNSLNSVNILEQDNTEPNTNLNV